MQVDSRTIVRALLSAAGIAPSEAEIEKMIESYPALRVSADSLYTDEISRFAPACFPTELDLEER